MTERPILFSAPMVRAILAGTKTQTRRAVKGMALEWLRPDGFTPEFTAAPENGLCPYGQPGDRLWVRETFAEGIHQMAEVNHWAYAADLFGEQQRLGDRWKPSIHMPRVASRITLEITGVRVERLQAISQEDARAEGVHRNVDGLWSGGAWKHIAQPNRYSDPCNAFCDLWASINGGESWDANPWVWVVEFKRVTA